MQTQTHHMAEDERPQFIGTRELRHRTDGESDRWTVSLGENVIESARLGLKRGDSVRVLVPPEALDSIIIERDEDGQSGFTTRTIHQDQSARVFFPADLLGEHSLGLALSAYDADHPPTFALYTAGDTVHLELLDPASCAPDDPVTEVVATDRNPDAAGDPQPAALVDVEHATHVRRVEAVWDGSTANRPVWTTSDPVDRDDDLPAGALVAARTALREADDLPELDLGLPAWVDAHAHDDGDDSDGDGAASDDADATTPASVRAARVGDLCLSEDAIATAVSTTGVDRDALLAVLGAIEDAADRILESAPGADETLTAGDTTHSLHPRGSVWPATIASELGEIDADADLDTLLDAARTAHARETERLVVARARADLRNFDAEHDPFVLPADD